MPIQTRLPTSENWVWLAEWCRTHTSGNWLERDRVTYALVTFRTGSFPYQLYVVIPPDHPWASITDNKLLHPIEVALGSPCRCTGR